MSTASESGAIQAQMFYLRPMAGRATTYTFDPPDGAARFNGDFDGHVVEVRNVRPQVDELSLDVHGFRLVNAPTAVTDFDDEAQVRERYYAETDALLREVTGGVRTFIFDHLVRRRAPGRPPLGYVRRGAQDEVPGPVGRAHADYTRGSAPQRVRDFLPAEAEALLARRFAQINVWRPIVGPLEDAPLALADARTIAAEDLAPNDLVYPHRTGETFLLRYNPAHRWYYAPRMRTDEALVFKNFDSDPSRAYVSPHSAFENPTASPDAPLRASIELRALVFF